MALERILNKRTVEMYPRGNRATYDSAEETLEHRRHWANARDLTPTVANSRMTRQKMRIRARYECDNNTYCRGMISTIGTDVMGPCGPQLQCLTGDTGLDSYIEEEWKRWGDSYEVNLSAKLHLMDEARRIEGEGINVMFTDDEAGESTGHSLNFNVISPRRVVNPEFSGVGVYATQGNLYNDDGVVINTKTGRPVSFQIVSEIDDLGYGGLIASKAQSIDARYVMQWFGPTRPSQYRGVCEIQAALPLFAYLRRYELATVSTAEIIASFTAFMKTQLPPGEGPPKVADFSEREITRGMLVSLPEGWEPELLDPKHPPANFEMFLNMILRGIGRVLNLPFGVVAGDHSKYNFASGRLDYRLYDDRLKKERHQNSLRIMNRLHREWLREFAMWEPRIAKVLETGKYYHTWRYASRPSISPKEDAETEDIRLKNGTTTYNEVYANRDGDWEESFEQRAKETEKIMELGLDKVLEYAPGKTSTPSSTEPGSPDLNPLPGESDVPASASQY